MKYADLPLHADVGVLLHCRTCGEEYSASGPDYFMFDGASEIRCGQCGTALQLMRKRVTLEPITPEASE